MNATIENSILVAKVQGRNLKGPRFEENLDPEGTLLVFLRHLGCTFCRETVSLLIEASRQEASYPSIVFVHQGNAEKGERFFANRWPSENLVAIADPELILYRAFRIARGTPKELMGPLALMSGVKGLLKGQGIGLPMGDPFLMPGVFYIKDGMILWSHDYRHIGDHPDFASIPRIIESSRT